jgi:hypothetical protein
MVADRASPMTCLFCFVLLFAFAAAPRRSVGATLSLSTPLDMGSRQMYNHQFVMDQT